MAIHELDASAVVQHALRALRCGPSTNELRDESAMAALIRRVASTERLITRRALIKKIGTCLQPLFHQADELTAEIETALEALVVGGDLVEIAEADNLSVGRYGPFLALAPPRFVRRRSGATYILGGAPDDQELLTQALACRVAHDGYHRVILDQPLPTDEELSACGLHELSEAVWLQRPKLIDAESLIREHIDQLLKTKEIYTDTSVRVIDCPSNGASYSQRWTESNQRSGFFVGRRPQDFGAPLWCFVELKDGQVKRLLDLPRRKWPWRPCDAAWYLQLAIDYKAGCPQSYHAAREQSEVILSFYSPLPTWASRRLMTIGRPTHRSGALLAYQIPLTELAAEEEFLQRHLWLSKV